MSKSLTVEAVAPGLEPIAEPLDGAEAGPVLPRAATLSQTAQPRLRRITLMLVDEQPIVQLGVSLIAKESQRPCRVIEATGGEDAIELARRERPDLVLLDPSLADLLLAEAVRRIGAVSPASRIVIFPAHVTPSISEEAARLGVHGLLGKDATPANFLSTIEAVARGEQMLQGEQRDALRRAAAKLNCAPLTPREHEIIRRAARGESNAEIASAIFLAPTTVKSYVQSALGKLEARNRVEAVFKLSELRLL
jgi:two-component system, NarL family, nitrate/nitrite response regulator NarL